MTRIIRLSFFWISILLLSAASAEADPCNLKPYLGINAELRHMGYKKGFGTNLFKQDLPQANLYIGLKFSDWFGVELGYKQTDKKSKTAANGEGIFELGRPIPIGATNVSENTVQIKAPYINLIGFLPVCDEYPLQLFGFFGVTRMSVKLKFQRTKLDEEVLTASVREFLVRDFSHRRTIVQVGTGLQYGIFNCLSVRTQIGWENTAKFNNLTNKQNTGYRASLKNSIIYSIGIIWNFN